MQERRDPMQYFYCRLCGVVLWNVASHLNTGTECLLDLTRPIHLVVSRE